MQTFAENWVPTTILEVLGGGGGGGEGGGEGERERGGGWGWVSGLG